MKPLAPPTRQNRRLRDHRTRWKPHEEILSFGEIANIVKVGTRLGIKKIRLMTNNPKKIVGLEGYGLEIVERVPIEIEVRHENAFYMQTKKDKMGHLLTYQCIKTKES